MNDEQKRIAYKAIDSSVEASTARQVIRYVMECELWNQDTISPSNAYLEKKYGWSNDTTKVAISKAKKSQFITTTGYGKNRCFELNIGFLKGEMAKVFQKSLRPRADFSDVLPERLANTLANGQANSSANLLANSFTGENGLTEPQNYQIEGDNSNNSNNNKITETKVSTFEGKSLTTDEDYEIVSDTPERKKTERKDKGALALREKLYTLFEKEFDVRPTPHVADYLRILDAMKRLNEKQILELVEEGIDSGKKKTVREALTAREVDIYLQNN